MSMITLNQINTNFYPKIPSFFQPQPSTSLPYSFVSFASSWFNNSATLRLCVQKNNPGADKPPPLKSGNTKNNHQAQNSPKNDQGIELNPTAFQVFQTFTTNQSKETS
jgi:hypothetical protein